MRQNPVASPVEKRRAGETRSQITHSTPREYEGRKDEEMFKKFIQRIIDSENREDAIDNVFYGSDGIDMAYQHGKITWKEHQMLLSIINKMA